MRSLLKKLCVQGADHTFEARLWGLCVVRYRRLITFLAVPVIAVVVGTSPSLGAGPVTKQNGSTPVLRFTSICAVGGYAEYGNCNGDVTTYTNIDGRMNAVQAKPGRYNLGFAFKNLTPGVNYRLWGNNGSFFSIGTAVADTAGEVRFSYQTSSPAGLGFDLNIVDGDITVVTSLWSGQRLGVNPDSSLNTLG